MPQSPSVGKWHSPVSGKLARSVLGSSGAIFKKTIKDSSYKGRNENKRKKVLAEVYNACNQIYRGVIKSMQANSYAPWYCSIVYLLQYPIHWLNTCRVLRHFQPIKCSGGGSTGFPKDAEILIHTRIMFLNAHIAASDVPTFINNFIYNFFNRYHFFTTVTICRPAQCQSLGMYINN